MDDYHIALIVLYFLFFFSPFVVRFYIDVDFRLTFDLPNTIAPYAEATNKTGIRNIEAELWRYNKCLVL